MSSTSLADGDKQFNKAGEELDEQSGGGGSIKEQSAGSKLKELEKSLPTLEQIEAIIAAEERELAEAEELLRKQQEEAERGEQSDEEAEQVTETVKPDEIEESIADESGGEEEEDEQEGQGEELDEGDEDEDEFDEDIEEDVKAEEDMVFLGFTDDDIKELGEGETSTFEIVAVFDPMVIIDDIIMMAIEKSEFKNADAVLRKKLDKKKLIIYIKQLWPQISQEQKKGILLQRKMVHYFRRKKYDRAFTEDSRTIVLDLIAKYYENLLVLDDIKGKRNFIEKDAETKIKELEAEQAELIELAQNDADKLEEVFREAAANCFSQKTGQFLSEKVINSIITKITTLRDQVSELRLALIKSQHRMAFLDEKAKKLEDLGDGLCQAEFEQLHAETQGLGDKIEERNNELSKLRVRCNSNTHIISSIREKLNMSHKTITGQQRTIKEQRDEVASMRNYLNSMKLERDKVRRRFKSRSFESGLLDKPILLHDYDATTERKEELEKSVQYLKYQMDIYTEKLHTNLSKLK